MRMHLCWKMRENAFVHLCWKKRENAFGWSDYFKAAVTYFS